MCGVTKTYRGQIHPYKEIIMEQLKQGVPSSRLSAKYGVAMSTITTWIKELPNDAIPSKYQYRNNQISVMRRVNETEARIIDTISDFIVCDISDEEWDDMQLKIQKELITLATSKMSSTTSLVNKVRQSTSQASK